MKHTDVSASRTVFYGAPLLCKRAEKKAARQSYSRVYAVKDLVSVTAFFFFVRRSDHIRMGNAQHRERAHPAKAKETGDGCVERQGAGSVLR